MIVDSRLVNDEFIDNDLLMIVNNRLVNAELSAFLADAEK